MKIRNKLLLIQLGLIIGFILAIILMAVNFSKATRFYDIQISGSELFRTAKNFHYSIRSIPYRPNPLKMTWEEVKTQASSYENKLNGFQNHKNYNILSKDFTIKIENLSLSWNQLQSAYIAPLNKEIETILELPEYKSFSDQNKSLSYIVFELKTNENTNTALFKKINNALLSSDSLVRYLDSNMMVFLSEIQIEMFMITEYFVKSAYWSTILISIILLFGAAGAGFYFSRSITGNIKELEGTITEITRGNFDIELKVKTDDEFGLLSSHFNNLTSELWGRLDTLKDIMQDIGKSIEVEKEVDIDRFYDYILELAIDSTGSDAAIILNTDEENEDYLAIQKMFGLFPLPLEVPTRLQTDEETILRYYYTKHIPKHKTLYGQAFTTQEPIFIKDNQESGELAFNDNPNNMFFIKSAIIIPLVVNKKVLGIMALIKKSGDTSFSDLDFAYMRAYGDFIALTNDTLLKYLELLKKHELTREIEVAADIQKSLLPEKMPVMKHALVSAYSNAAKGVSGDYFDAYFLDQNRMAIIVCDVSGKGVPASLLMIMIRTVLRTISDPSKNARRILTELNRAITGRLGADRFATIGFFIFDQKKMEISYSNGAHHPLYIYRAEDHKFRMFDTDGLPLGIDINASYGHKMIKVKPGDQLILYTDGLPEARNPEGEELGTNNILRFIANNADKEPKKMVEIIQKFIKKFVSSEKQHDDETFLIMKIK